MPRHGVAVNTLRTGWKKSISLDLCLLYSCGLLASQYNMNSPSVKCRRLPLWGWCITSVSPAVG